ncbi:MAG: Glu/Leu/Phe/Val dehydrogenase dimerization region [Frankiales bacterium]|nr:Glu/Leu/Phe/Val dehydrogenase dimerization region [Frankiales bacterium]
MGVFDRTDHLKDAGHEQVVFCQDRASGLKAIIAVYSTALGPALGGTRFYPYASEDDALEDVLKLSKAMAYKAACSGIDLGGGKAVIIGDPTRDKTEALLRAYGRFVQSLGGRYYTACDVGTYVQDMDVIAKETDFATGRSPENGGAGDSAVLTAFGVFQAMRAAAEHTWGGPTLHGKRVAVEGVGKVGHHLVEHLVQDGATVVVSDVSAAALERVRAAFPQVEVLDVDALRTAEMDVYAPCALGGSVSDELVPVLQAKVVCGAANNQLEHPGIEKSLADRGVLYAPDYVANAGGLCQVADEALHDQFSFARAEAKAATIYDTTLSIFRLADSEGVPPAVAADRLGERRMADVGRLRSVLVPGRS